MSMFKVKWISRSIAIRFFGFWVVSQQRNMHLSLSLSLSPWLKLHTLNPPGIFSWSNTEAGYLFFPNSNSRICTLQHTSKIFSLQSGSLFTIAICTRHETRFEFLTDLGLNMAKRPKATCRSSRGHLAMRKIMCSSRILKEAKLAIAPLVIHITPRNTDKNTLPSNDCNEIKYCQTPLNYWSASWPTHAQTVSPTAETQGIENVEKIENANTQWCLLATQDALIKVKHNESPAAFLSHLCPCTRRRIIIATQKICCQYL